MSASDLGNKDLTLGLLPSHVRGVNFVPVLSNTDLSPTLRTEVNPCPPPQVTILTPLAVHLGQAARGWSATFRQATGSAASPPRSRARNMDPLLQSPCTAPLAASPFPGLTHCRGCFKEASEMRWYHSTWDKLHGCWQVGAGARGDKDYSWSHNQTFPQILAICPGSDRSILKKQQSPNDPLKTTSKVQQDIQEGESLTGF